MLHLYILLNQQSKRGHLLFLSSSRWAANHPNLFYFLILVVAPLALLTLLALCTVVISWPIAILLGLI